VKLQISGLVYDPTDAVGRLLFDTQAMIAEFESDLLNARTRERMKVAKARGRLKGQAAQLSAKQEAHLVTLHQDEHTGRKLAELFGVARSAVYRP
jgi:DNA invertase Pin-like site-specific DNA recombinase